MLAVEEHQALTVTENKYCHIVCSCTPKLGICGAYKPTLCGYLLLSRKDFDTCNICEKPYCELCEGLVMHVCPYCEM